MESKVKDTNIHCYYKSVGQGATQGSCPEFHCEVWGGDRDGCEAALHKMVNKKCRDAARCFTDHATGEEPKQ